MTTSRRATGDVPGPAGPRLHATLELARSRHYRRPGGPWDLGTLDAVLSAAHSRAHPSVADDRLDLDAGAFERAVASIAGGLRAVGVRRHDTVAWQLPNCVEALLLYRACWRIGAVAAPLHHLAGEADVHSAMSQVSPRIMLTTHGSAMTGSVPVHLLSLGDLDSLPSGTPIAPEASPSRSSDLAAVLFTAGSTGRPKAVLHTGRGLAWKAVLMREVHGLDARDAVLMPAPLAHISGLLNGLLVPAACGMRSVLMAKWDPDQALEALERERISFMVGPPTFFVGMTSAPGFRRERAASLRLVSSGGAAVTPAFVDSTSELLGCLVKRTYGSTEAPSVSTTTSGDSASMARETEGHAVGEVELRVSDPVTGGRQRAGRPGELWVRGPELFVGYADRSETEAAHARGSWFRTGDLATVDVGGWLRIVGRIKDVIIRGGENISASEVEAVLEAHPSVRQAAAVPYPDPLLGERVAAYLVAREPLDVDAVRAWFDKRRIARFKVPERVVLVDSLPTLAAGKPDRACLRERARDLAG